MSPKKGSGLFIRNGVLLYKQLIHPMMDFAYPIWRSTTHAYARKLQASILPWYICNRQILEDLGVAFIADHIRALTKRFNSKLADEEPFGSYLC
jgi:hypothetical protein